MLKNYVITALRNIIKNALASVITVVGFSIGIACVLFIFLFLQYEMSFDRFLPGHERVYRIAIKAATLQGGDLFVPNANYRIKDPLLSENGGIEAFTQYMNSDAQVGYGNRYFFEAGNFILTDSSFLKVLGYTVSVGGRSALDNPLSVVISPAAAEKYFGSENPIGKVLSYKNGMIGDTTYYFTVTGVLEKLPRNSRLTFDFVANYPFDSMLVQVTEYYNRVYNAGIKKDQINLQMLNYVKLKDNSFLPRLEKSLRGTASTIASADLQHNFKDMRLVPEALDSLYLFSPVPASPGESKGNFLFLLLLAGLAVVVIVIACINVINLTTARALTRMKEIGIRKTLGASRGELMLQYLTESVLLSFISLLFAAVMVELLLPFFNLLIDRELAVDYLRNPLYFAALIGAAASIGVLSGFYPAFYLSSLDVNNILRGRKTPSSRRFREIMVVIQFIFSIALFITAAVILREFQYMKTMDPGFSPGDVAMVRMNVPQMEKKFPDIKKAVAAVPGVLGVSATSLAAWENGAVGKNIPLLAMGVRGYVDIMVVDPDYFTVQGIDIVEGRNFDTDTDSPFSRDVIINEAARRQYGFHLNSTFIDSQYMAWVVGVAEDFNYEFPSRKPGALIMTTLNPYLINTTYSPTPVFLNYMLVKLRPEGQQEVLAGVEKVWKDFNPGYAFEYAYEEDEIKRQLDGYNRSFESMLGIATVLAFLLSGLGLFGLATFEIERRTKEVGIRKALGATTGQVVVHFLLGFLKLIGVANVIAWPATFLSIRLIFGLIQYPHPLLIGPIVFLEAGLISVAVMAVTVGSQVVRAASSNPVNTLRYE